MGDGAGNPAPNPEVGGGGFAAAIGQDPPSREQMGGILKLAAVAAHASHRTAAPMACWLAGVSGRDLDELIAEAERLAG
jgi:hypothetical protein